MKLHAKCLLPAGLALALLVFAGVCRAQLPPSKGAPQVGQKAPDFTLLDTASKPVKLSELLAPNQSAPAVQANGQTKAPWVLLIFYRGYW